MIHCFDIGGSFIKYGVPDADGLVPEIGRIPTPGADFTAFVDALRTGIEAMPHDGPGAVSISLAGISDEETGRAVVANVPCLNGRRLEAELSSLLARPVRITNDADCFALAEAHRGVGQGHANVFAIILGSGVGGGLVLNGQLVRGAGGVSGEWGHGPIVDPAAGGLIDPLPRFVCGCGRTDCLDAVGGARGLERLHAALNGVSASSQQIIDRWKDGDAAASRSVAVLVEHLARVLGVVVNTVGASVVAAGGGLAAEPDLVAALDKRVREFILARHSRPLVVQGQRVRDGGLVGAALAGVALEELAA